MKNIIRNDRGTSIAITITTIIVIVVVIIVNHYSNDSNGMTKDADNNNGTTNGNFIKKSTYENDSNCKLDSILRWLILKL